MNRHTRGRSEEVVNHSNGGLFLLLTLSVWIWRYYGTQTLTVVKVYSSGRCVECLKGVTGELAGIRLISGLSRKMRSQCSDQAIG